MANNNELERRVTLENDNSERVELCLDTFGGEMRVDISVPAYVEDGVVKQPRQTVQFASAEWDYLVAEVERFRAARKLFNLPA